MAWAQREVCRAEQALAESLADQHAAAAKLYHLRAQGLDRTTNHLEINVGMVHVAMRWHGVHEPIPSSSGASIVRELVQENDVLRYELDGKPGLRRRFCCRVYQHQQNTEVLCSAVQCCTVCYSDTVLQLGPPLYSDIKYA